MAEVNLMPTDGMKAEARRYQQWKREGHGGGTRVAAVRAAQILSGKPMSAQTVKVMRAWFARHEVDKQGKGFNPGEDGYPSNGRVAWAAWGGDAGKTWAEAKMRSLESRAEKAESRGDALARMAEEHNKEHGDKGRVTVGTLETVFDRGVGAYRTNPSSVRPNVNSPEQWAYARVKNFLRTIRTGRFRSGKHDTDLLPKDHPMASDAEKSFHSAANVLKVDDALGLVLGWAVVCKTEDGEYYDTQGDHIPEEAMLKAATDFMLNSRTAGDMHAKADGKIVFCWPMTTDIAKAFGFTTKQTGLLVAMKPDSPEILEKFRRGEYTGFSIGGRRVKDEVVT